MAWKYAAIALVLLALLSSAAFADPLTQSTPRAESLLSQIFSAPPAAGAAVSTPLASQALPAESVCSQCVSSRCPTICHKPATCELDPDTGCFFCSCFLNA
jgi:hypothetical protein